MKKVWTLNKSQRKELEMKLSQQETVIQTPIQLELPFCNTPLSNNPETIDVVCTATRRPAIVEQTFKSFSEKFFKKHPTRLIINVDPIGENCSNEAIINIGRKYFGEVVANTPSKPNFFRAFKWVFTNCTSKYIFHLQDDWLLLKDHDIKEFIDYLDSNSTLACVQMPFRVKHEGITVGNIMIGTRYYDHPALWKREFYDEVMPCFNTNCGTEAQIRGMCVENSADMLRITGKWYYGIYHDGHGGSIRDIGRNWLGATGFNHRNNTDARDGWLVEWTRD